VVVTPRESAVAHLSDLPRLSARDVTPFAAWRFSHAIENGISVQY
jgi:hypothetical protein